MPFASLVGLLLCHCSVELLQSRGKRLPFSGTADPGQGLWERAEAPSPRQEITATVLLWGREGAVPPLPVGLRLFQLRSAAESVEQAALALGVLPAHKHTHTHLLRTVGCLPIERQTAEAFGHS